MNKYWERIIILTTTALLSYLAYLVLVRAKCMPLWVGLLTGGGVFLGVLIICIINPKLPITENPHATLLEDMLVLGGSSTLMVWWIHDKQMELLPLAILGMLVCVESISFWIADKCYKNKSLKQILSNEIRFHKDYDILSLAWFAYGLITDKYDLSFGICLIILFFAIDYLRQSKIFKKSK